MKIMMPGFTTSARGLAQAVAQFETWTGLEAPLAEMKSAALFLAHLAIFSRDTLAT